MKLLEKLFWGAKMNSVYIRTPATTANLGPGFDCLGVSVELYNYLNATWEKKVNFKKLSDPELINWLQNNAKVTIQGEGKNELTSAGINLFFQALAEMLTLPPAGCLLPKNLTLTFNNKIPLARGLGSSAACIVSALSLGKEILSHMGMEIDRELLLTKAVKLDNYPDNVYPAYLGGAHLIIEDGKNLPLTFSLEIPKDLNFIFVIPDMKIISSESRRVLPESVVFEDAVKNSALLGGLILAFSKRDFSRLKKLIKSPLHIPYRSKLIPGYENVEKAAYEHNALAFTISGAGPTVLAVADKNCERIGAAMVKSFNSVGISANYFVSKVDSGGVISRYSCI